MVSRKIDDKHFTITLNATGTCKKCLVGGSLFGGILIGVPLAIVFILLWAKLIFRISEFVTGDYGVLYSSGDWSPPLVPALMAFFGLVATIVLAIVGSVHLLRME